MPLKPGEPGCRRLLPSSFSGIALMSIALLIGSAALEPATATGAIPQIRIRAIPELPRLQLKVPRPALAGVDELSVPARYGLVDPSSVAALDDAGRGLSDDVDAAANEVLANTEARATLKRCTGTGLEEAGTSYRDAVQQAAFESTPTPAPDHEQVVEGIAGCLTEYFPDAPDEMFQMGTYLAGLAFERSQEANTEAQSAAVLAEWMTTTGAELAAVSQAPNTDPIPVPPTSTEEDPDSESGFPVWGAIAVVVGLLGLAALVRNVSG